MHTPASPNEPRRAAPLWALALLPLLLPTTGCLDRDLRAVVPCTVSSVARKVKVNTVDAIDLLFVVDNSGSMEQEQAALQAEIPRLVEVLATGDVGLDGSNEDDGDFRPVASIHFGVITTDLGVGPGAGFGGRAPCTDYDDPWGDDGVLMRAAAPDTLNDCSGPAFLSFDTDGDDVDPAVDYIRCVGDVGTAGCGIEQQLEATLKAVTPSASPIRFVQLDDGVVIADTPGQADGANAGFFRDDALLAIIMVTDEDDCSSAETRLFDALNESRDVPYPVPLVDGEAAPDRQCPAHRDAQYAVQRYVDGLLAARTDPSRLIFATIAGVSPALIEAARAAAEGGANFYDTILDDPSMDEVVDADDERFIRTSCTRPDPNAPEDDEALNRAYPPRRIVTVARDLQAAGATGVVTSICNARDPEAGDYAADFGPALDEIIERIREQLQVGCLPRPLIRDGRGEVNCDVIEILPVGQRCEDYDARGRRPLDPPRMEPGEDGIIGTADDQEACRIVQVVPTAAERADGRAPAGGIGWYYDDYADDLGTSCAADTPQRLSFTGDATPLNGAEIRLECLEPVRPSGERNDIGTPCSPEPDTCALADEALASLRSQYDRDSAQLTCDPDTNTCQIGCESDAQCPGGYVCFEDASPDTLRDEAFCVNPTCGGL